MRLENTIGRVILAALLVSLLLSGCGSQKKTQASDKVDPMPEIQVTEEKLTIGDKTFKFKKKDLDTDWDRADAVFVHLADGQSTVEKDGEKLSGTDGSIPWGISVEGDTIVITEEGTYVFDGKLSDGKILADIENDGDLRLVFAGVDIHSETSAPVDITGADKTVLILEAGTENLLSDSANLKYRDSDEEEPNAALFCKNDLTITGKGSLTVDGAFNNAIISKDRLKIMDGTYRITAVNHGLKGNDAVLIRGGDIQADCGGDGIKSDLVTAVLGGNIRIENSEEGIEGETVLLAGGTVYVASKDDGINAASDKGAAPVICITGSEVTVDAEGDGIDSNGNIYMTDGRLTVHGPEKKGNGALDYDYGFQMDGGNLAAFGPGDMDKNVSASSQQPALLMRWDTLQPAGTEVVLKDGAGTERFRTVSEKSFLTAVISIPDLVLGEKYELAAGETRVSFTLTDRVTYLNKDGISNEGNPGTH